MSKKPISRRHFGRLGLAALGMLAVSVIMLALIDWISMLPWPLWATSMAIFVVAWIGQFIGHACEGKRPSFFRDLQFLLIGPLWILADLYQRAGIGFAHSKVQE